MIAICVRIGANWEITAYFRDLPAQGNEDEEAKLWVPTDTKQWMQPCEITPIKSMDSSPLKVQLYMEHPSLTDKKV
jgi:mitotic spindle assembly checkpoint protein MAD2B